MDGKNKITQSNAILRYIARKHNMCEWVGLGTETRLPALWGVDMPRVISCHLAYRWGY